MALTALNKQDQGFGKLSTDLEAQQSLLERQNILITGGLFLTVAVTLWMGLTK
jgi:hypothetical protein